MQWEAYEPGEPLEGEVLVRHKAIGVNFIDVYHRTGLYPLPALPAIPGMEASGIVEQVGSGVSDFKPGDRVAYAEDLFAAVESKAVKIEIGQTYPLAEAHRALESRKTTGSSILMP
jgi:NADPH:quinone reductase-like Zn-dependent oxidoreductase